MALERANFTGAQCCSFEIEYDPINTRTVLGEAQRRVEAVVVTVAPEHDVSIQFNGLGRDQRSTRLNNSANRTPLIRRFDATRIEFEQEFIWHLTHHGNFALPGSVGTPTSRTTGGSTDGADIPSFTTAAFTPTSSGLLLINVAYRDQGGTPPAPSSSVTDTHTGTGTYTSIGSAWIASGREYAAEAIYAQLGASPGSGTLTVTHATGGGEDHRRVGWVVGDVAGHDSSAPVPESNTGTATAGTTHQVSIADIDSGNLMVGFGCFEDDTPTAGTSNTLLAASSSGGGNPAIAGFVYATIVDANWASLVDTNAKAGVAIEIKQAAGGGDVRNHIIPAYMRING